jgi:hypothetical protein
MNKTLDPIKFSIWQSFRKYIRKSDKIVVMSSMRDHVRHAIVPVHMIVRNSVYKTINEMNKDEQNDQ